MKKVYVNEDWCLGCHLCEFYCAAAHSGEPNMVKAFSNGKKPVPRITVEEGSGVNSVPPLRQSALRKRLHNRRSFQKGRGYRL